MAIKDLLFHLTPDEAGAPASEFAVSLALAHGAHLTAASVVIDYRPQLANGGGFAGGLEFNLADSFAELTEQSRKAVREAYERLAKSLPAEVVAEGVETAVSVGCKVAEGYLFGRPMPNPCSDRMAATKFVAQKAAGAAWRPMRGKSASEISPGRRSPVNDAVSVSGTTCVSL